MQNKAISLKVWIFCSKYTGKSTNLFKTKHVQLHVYKILMSILCLFKIGTLLGYFTIKLSTVKPQW